VPRGEGVVKKIVLVTTISIALLNNSYASSLPNCGDREVLHVIEGMMRDTAHKQIDSMGDLQLKMAVTGLIQQMAMNALTNGKVENSEPTCTPQLQGTIVPSQQGGSLVTIPTRPGEAPIKQLPPCEPKKAESQKEMDINQVRSAMGIAIDNTVYNFSAPRVDGDSGNKKFCSINLNTSGVNWLGQSFSLKVVDEYTVQLTEENKYWIELNKETQAR
jgi:hypothetical protein